MTVMKIEQTGWLLSGALHVGIAVAALVGLPKLAREMPEPPPPIAIEFVQIAEKTRVVAPEAPAKEPEQVQSKPQPTLAAAEAAPAVDEQAVPTLDKVKPAEATPEPKPKPKPQVSENRQLANRVTPRAKPKPPSRLKVKRITALLDKSIKEQQEATPEPVEEKKPVQKEPAKTPDVFAGLRGRLSTASLRDAIQAKVEQNWRIPAGAKGIQDMQVSIRIWLRPDGYYSRAPEFIGAGDLNDPNRAFFRVFAESARRAVLRSEPLDEAAKYLESGQQYIDFNFYPSSFEGG